jgi:hypothetical protein
MSVQQRLRVAFEDVFPLGAFMLGVCEAVEDFDLVRAARESGREPGDVQTRDKVSGKRVWSVRVVDADPDARKGQAELTVKIDADHCPTPPPSQMVGPFRPVVFEGLTLTPYIDENGRRARLAYSMRASGFADAGKGDAGKSGSHAPAKAASAAAVPA